MFYDFALTVKTTHTESAPLEQTLKLTHGIIHRVEIGFPSGCNGLVRCKLLHEEHQYLPTNPDGYFASDGYNIPIDDYFELYTEPYSLKFIGYGVGCGYDHVITVRVGVLPKEVVEPTTALSRMFEKFLKLVGLGG